MGTFDEYQELFRTKLPRIGPSQKKFLDCILDGEHRHEAILTAYPWLLRWSKGRKSVIERKADEMWRHPSVQAWLTHYKQVGAISADCSLSDHMAQLERLRELAIATGNISAAVNAEAFRGRAAGHYVERISVTHDNVTPLQVIERIATVAPELAQSLAKEKGIEFQPKVLELEPEPAQAGVR